MTIKEEALFGKIDIQTPNFAVMGFVLGFSRLGDSMAASDGAYNTGTYNWGTYNIPQTPTAWTSWLGKALRVSIKRGGVRTGLGIKTDVGLLTFTLRNDQDPLKGGSFRHGQPIRVLSNGSAIFTGYIIDVAASYPLDKSTGEITSLVTVTAADAVKTHAGTPRYGVRLEDNGNETFESRIARLTEGARTPVIVPGQTDPQEVYSF